MMNFKNRNGFLLLEAVFATFIVGMIMGPLFISQNNILKHLSAGLAHMERLYVAKNFLLQTIAIQKNIPEDQKQVEKKEIDPETNMIFSQEAMVKQSAFSTIKNLSLAKVQFGWEWAGNGKSDTLCYILFTPPPLEVAHA